MCVHVHQLSQLPTLVPDDVPTPATLHTHTDTHTTHPHTLPHTHTWDQLGFTIRYDWLCGEATHQADTRDPLGFNFL